MREVVTNFLNFAKPDQPTLSPVDLRRHRRARRRRSARRRARAGRRHPRRRRVRRHRGRRRAAAAGVQQPAAERDRGVCRGVDRARRSASKREIDRAQGVCTITVARQRARFPRAYARARLPPVLHDQGAGHRSGSGAGAEDCRHAQRPGRRRPRVHRRRTVSRSCSRWPRTSSARTVEIFRSRFVARGSRCNHPRG